MSEKKRKGGRPPEQVPKDKARSIIEWISEGKTLRDWCRAHGVGYTTVYDWMAKDEKFAEDIARARETGEEVIAQECLEIADDGTNDYVMTKQGVLLDKEAVLRSKLRIETRLKLLAKWNPKKWGERQQIEHTGKLTLESLVAGGE